MGTAKEERAKAARGEGCLGKAADDEPVFVLRAQDQHAAALVRAWADMAEGTRCPAHKVAEARQLAADMAAWPNRKAPD